MGKRRRLSISFKAEYSHIYDFLVQKPNISEYICRLINDEIRKENSARYEEIRRVVWEILRTQEFSGINIPPSIIKSQLSNEDIELIDQLF